jgi:hypothetical protein
MYYNMNKQLFTSLTFIFSGISHVNCHESRLSLVQDDSKIE